MTLRFRRWRGRPGSCGRQGVLAAIATVDGGFGGPTCRRGGEGGRQSSHSKCAEDKRGADGDGHRRGVSLRMASKRLSELARRVNLWSCSMGGPASGHWRRTRFEHLS